MTDYIEALISEWEADQRDRVAAFADRLRAAARAPAQTADRKTLPAKAVKERFENAAEAFDRHGFPFDDQKVRRICKRHSDEGGFAVNLGVWNVRQPGFDDFAELVKRGQARF
ncbi:uncharacterized protein YozE (UPF0346 family) [Nitrobacteraceae bacterium AZCC 2146]